MHNKIQQNTEDSATRGSICQFQFKGQQGRVTIRSNFDSGNGQAVKQISSSAYRIECTVDGIETGHPVNSKGWFYFRAQGFPLKSKVKFTVVKVQALLGLYYSKYSRCYRPVYRTQAQPWQRVVKQCELNLNQDSEIQCVIEHVFKEDWIEFAFCYPYEYSRNVEYVQNLKAEREVYLHRQIMVKSPEDRQVHLLTITNNNLGQLIKEDMFDETLFPDRNRPKKFNKPVVLITGRVHPGETAASYAMQGVINFLLNSQDLRAHLLRDMFVFMIVPMINVDGVYHGHFRMDTYGHNLNRFYINPSLTKHPAIYGIKTLAKHLMQQNRLCFYCDLHGHNAKKGCFIYGNAFPDFVEQVQSQIFCKVMGTNHAGFEYEYCNFSQRHMNAKDRCDDLTKEGCGRVVMHREVGLVHSYSLQCGSIAANKREALPKVINPHFSAANRGLPNQESDADQYEQLVTLADNSVLFTVHSYRSLGKSLLISLLDIFDRNPYNRVYNSRYTSMEMLRRVTAFQIFHSAERFRMFEKSIFGKVKNINLLVQEVLYSKSMYRGLFGNGWFQDGQLNRIQWPKKLPGLLRTLNKGDSCMKMKKGKSLMIGESQQQISFQKNEIANRQDVEQPEQHKQQQFPKQVDKIRQADEIKSSKNAVQYAFQIKQFCEQDKIQFDQILETARKHKLDFNKRSSDLTIHAENPDLGSDSDDSQLKQTQLNQQLLLLCQNQKQKQALMAKILDDDFGQDDYQDIQNSYKSKMQSQKDMKVLPSSQGLRKMGSSRQGQEGKYRVTRKVLINTCDITHPRKRNQDLKKTSDNHYNIIEVEQNLSKMNKRPTPAEQFRKNIYDAIKVQIKQGLRRQYDRRRHRERMNIKMVDHFKPKPNRTRSTHQPQASYMEGKRMKSKVKLPSLGANMYIVTTSTRVLHKS